MLCVGLTLYKDWNIHLLVSMFCVQFRDALNYAVDLLSEFDNSQRATWIEKIIAALAKQNGFFIFSIVFDY